MSRVGPQSPTQESVATMSEPKTLRRNCQDRPSRTLFARRNLKLKSFVLASSQDDGVTKLARIKSHTTFDPPRVFSSKILQSLLLDAKLPSLPLAARVCPFLSHCCLRSAFPIVHHWKCLRSAGHRQPNSSQLRLQLAVPILWRAIPPFDVLTLVLDLDRQSLRLRLICCLSLCVISFSSTFSSSDLSAAR